MNLLKSLLFRTEGEETIHDNADDIFLNSVVMWGTRESKMIILPHILQIAHEFARDG